MAQHDYILDNQSGANFRADLNNALLAISSNNSGASQPSTMYAYEWWIDTSNNLLKLRNSGNDAWITLPISITADNTVDINGGTVNGISSLSFSSGATVTAILDEDDLSSNSATGLATQQSIKAYVDAQLTAQDLDITDGSSTIAIDLDSETLSLLGGTGVTAAASGNGVTFSIGQAVSTSSNVVFNQVTAALVGNSSTATALATARTINGVSFDGSSNISFDSDAVSEGSSNLYFTNARARAAISESSTQLSYNSSTGVLTYTQGDTDTVSEGSSNLYHTTARVQAVSINNVVEDTTPQLGGNLDVNGQEIVSVSNGNIALTPNGTGVVRIDGSTGVDIQQGSISIKNGGTQSYIDFYCEVSNAHYARLQAPAHASFGGNITITLPSTTGTIALTSSNITGNSATATALQNARTISGVSFDGTSNITLDTDDIGEGSTNKYFTAERVDDQVNTLLTAGSGITLTYDDAAGTLTIDGQTGDITSVVAGDGLTGGGTSGDVTLAVGVDNSSIEISSDAIRVKASGITNAMLGGSIANSKLANSSVTVNSNSVALGASITLDTDDIGEGSSNLYHTSSRVNTLIDSRVTKTFVDNLGVVAASLSTPRAIALSGDVVGTANFDGSAGISISTTIQANSVALGTDTSGNYVSTIAGTSNEIEVSGSGSETAAVTIGLPDDVTISNDLTVSGNLTVTGTTTQTGATITDSNFQGFTEGNTGNVTDFGFYGKYVESTTTKYAGLFYDASTDNTFRLFCDTQTRPSTTVNTGATGYAKASLVADLVGNSSTASTLETARTINGVSFNGSANISFDSDAVSEGSSNLYFTNERASDLVGSMVTGNTETGITVTYEDGDNTLDFVINSAQTTITSILATDLKVGEDDETKIDFETADEIHFYAANQHQIKLTDGALIPVTTNDIDLGTSSLEYKDAFFDGVVTSDSFVGELTGNSSTATKLATTRAIALGGDLGGSANFDGSAAITITATIQADSVEQSMIADDSVGADQLAASAVVTGSIVDDAITQDKIADDAVGSAQIADNSVDIARLNVSDGSNGQVLTTDGSGNLSFASASGGASDLNGLSDCKTFGTSSLMIGDATTGTIDAANYNIGVGIDIFTSLTTGDNNIAMGFEAVDALTTGGNNVGIGYKALSASNSSWSVAIGSEALKSEATSGSNVAIGGLSMMTSNGASNNTAVGKQTGYLLTDGDYNVFIGSNCAFNQTSASNNVGVGYLSIYSCTTGSELVGIGPKTLTNATTAVSCIAIGDRAFENLIDAPYNVAIGYKSGQNMENGASNEGSCTFVGDSSGRSVTSGKQNTMIGASAAHGNSYATTTGYRNTIIGSGTHGNASDSNTEIVIGFGARGIGNGYITLGSDSGRTYVGAGSTNWAGTSDVRLKENIVDEPIGLDFINELRPVKYNWKKRKDVDPNLFPSIYEDQNEDRVIPSQDGIDKHGFIAQELENTIKKYSSMGDGGHDIFYKTNDGTYTASPSALIPMLVKALQEADDKIDSLTARIEALEV